MFQAATIVERELHVPERANELYAETVQLNPGSAVARIVGRRSRAALVPLFEQEASLEQQPLEPGDSRRLAALLLRRAQEQMLGRSDAMEIRETIARAVEADPRSLLAIDLLRQLPRDGWFVNCMAKLADSTTLPWQRRLMLGRIAALYEGALDTPDLALECYCQLTAAEAGDESGYGGRRRILAQSNQWALWAKTLGEQAAADTNSVRKSCFWTTQGWWHLGIQAKGIGSERGHSTPSGDDDMARERFAAALAVQPGTTPATLGRVVLATISERGIEMAECWSEQARALGAAPLAAERDLRAGLAYEEVVGDLVRAAECYRRAEALCPKLPGVGAARGRVERDGEGREGVLRELLRRLERSDEPGQRYALLMAAARLKGALGRSAEEVSADYLRAIELQGRHPAAPLALLQHYERVNNLAAARDFLAENYLAQARTPSAKREALCALRELDLRLEQQDTSLERSIAIWESRPLDLGAAFELLSGAYGDVARETRLRLFRAIADATSDPQDQASLCLATVVGDGSMADAQVMAGAGHTHAAETAFALEKALEQIPSNRWILHLLVTFASALREQELVARCYSRLGESTSDALERSLYLCRLGQTRTELEPYVRSLASDSRSLGAIVLLRDKALMDENWSMALQALLAQSQATSVQGSRLAALMAAGEAAERKLDEPNSAARIIAQAVDAFPGDSAPMEYLLRLLIATEQWDELIVRLSDQLERKLPIEEEALLRRQIADIALTRMNDPGLAIDQLRSYVEVYPEDASTWQLLGELCTKAQRWDEAAEALLSLAKCRPDGPDRPGVLFRLACIYQDCLGDERALLTFQRVLELDPAHLAAHCRLAELLLENNEHDRALDACAQALALDPAEPGTRLQLLMCQARAHEAKGDQFHAAKVYREALEIAPTDLAVVRRAAEFFERQGDRQSLVVQLERSVTILRANIERDPFDLQAYSALAEVLRCRDSKPGVDCVNEVLELIEGPPPTGERSRTGAALAPGEIDLRLLGETSADQRIFENIVPGGFRQIFSLLSTSLGKIRPGDIDSLQLTRRQRISDKGHPLRTCGDRIAAQLGVAEYDVYVAGGDSILLLAENTVPPAVVVGARLLDQADLAQRCFIMGRCLWIIRKSMVLPTRLRAEDLELLVAAVIRQYVPDYLPPTIDKETLEKVSHKIVKSKIIPKRIRQELMPFVLECSGGNLPLRDLHASIIYSANRAALIACGSLEAAVVVLHRAAGRGVLGGPADQRAAMLRGNSEIEELLCFSVSEDCLQLRQETGGRKA
jgi:tetratricopeptide (TPR) repeat protein